MSERLLGHHVKPAATRNLEAVVEADIGFAPIREKKTSDSPNLEINATVLLTWEVLFHIPLLA